MKTRQGRVLPFAVITLVLLGAGTACADGPFPPPNVGQTPLPGDLAKIDVPLQGQLTGSARLPVAILLRTQMLLGPSAFDAFVETNAGRPRSMMRAEVINTLQETARSEQAELLELLGSPPDAHGLWIANVVFVSLTPSEVRAATEHDLVRYVYLMTATPSKLDAAGTVSQVLRPGPRAAFSTDGKTVPWNLEDIGARRVWDELGITGLGAVITMVDVGTDYTHPDLRDNIWTNPGEVPNNGVDDDGNGLIDDYYGYNFGAGRAEVHVAGTDHGTYTAGIAVGDGTGGIITGVAPRARLMVTVAGGVYSAGRIFEYALEEGGDIATMSFSIPGLGNVRGLWRLMADHATAAGLVLVSGAGNFQQTAAVPVQQRIPEGIPSVISVGGVDQNRNLRSFSSLGPVSWESVKFYEDHPSLTKPDVAAFPGPDYPILLEGSGYMDPNPSTAGNSFSGPHAAGVAALMLSANPELPAWEVKSILEATASDIAPDGKDNRTGAGLIDAFAAVEEALRRR